jgi:site-specific recombinase XerD
MERSEDWLTTLSRKLRSPDTVRTYRTSLKFAWEFGRAQGWPSDPRRIQPEHIWALYQELQHFSTSTQKTYIWTVLKFLIWSGNTNVTDVELKITVSRSRVDWLTVEQVGQLVAACRTSYERAAIAVMAYTGARAGETADLRLTEAQPNQLILRGKGRKERAVPVDTEFWETIGPYLEYRSAMRTKSSRFLVHLWRGRTVEFNRRSIGGLVTMVSKRCGFHCSPHTIRRSFLRHLWLNGCSVEQIQRIAGHSSIEMTIRYLGIGEFDLRSAIEKFRPSYAKAYREGSSQQVKHR